MEFFEAEIGVDAFLSYPTLRRLHLMLIADEGKLAKKHNVNWIDRLTPIFPPAAKVQKMQVGLGTSPANAKKALAQRGKKSAGRGAAKAACPSGRGASRDMTINVGRSHAEPLAHPSILRGNALPPKSAKKKTWMEKSC